MKKEDLLNEVIRISSERITTWADKMVWPIGAHSQGLCYSESHPLETYDMNDLKRFVDSVEDRINEHIDAHGSRWVMLSDGKPFLNPGVRQFLTSHSFCQSFFLNGWKEHLSKMILYPDPLDYISESGLVKNPNQLNLFNENQD